MKKRKPRLLQIITFVRRDYEDYDERALKINRIKIVKRNDEIKKTRIYELKTFYYRFLSRKKLIIMKRFVNMLNVH